MASAVLTTQNEPHWRNPNDYMSKYTSISAATTPDKSRNRLSHRHSHGDFHTGYDPKPCPLPLPVYANSSTKIGHSRLGRTKSSSMLQPDLSSPPISGNSQVKEFRHGRRVTFNLGVHSARELEELKRRLVSELQQVRFLKTRLERLNSEARPAYPSYQYSHGCSQQPPALLQPRFPNRAGIEMENYEQKVAWRGAQSKKKFPVPGQGLKRRSSLPDDLDPNPKRQAKCYPVQEKVVVKRCGQILAKVMKDRGAVWFNKPVDVEGMKLFDYYQVVKNPMDLGTVKSNLEAGFYEYPSDFASDVRLTFSNAMKYNPIGHIVYETAKKLLKLFDGMFEPAKEKFEAEQRSVSRQIEDVARSEPAFIERVPSHQLYLEASEQQLQAVGRTPVVEQQLRIGKLPKPKARQPNKREMSVAERSSLGKELEELPHEKLEQAVQIVRKRNEKLDRENGEVVLEMDDMDVETLWELDRFVTNYRKSLKKMKRDEQLQNQDVESKSITEAKGKAPETNVGVVRSKVVEEEVDIGEEIPVGNYPSVEIEKDINGCGSDKSSSSSSGGSSGSRDSSSSSGMLSLY
ncbi:Transcription factor GTE3, chloroplastic [Linum grandiflorum]